MKNPVEVNAIIAELERLYPDALCSLEYKKDYELLFAVRLSAQCTDCLLYTSPSPRDISGSRMPSSA